MKKEVVFSIVIGFGIGLVATFGIYTARRSLKEASQIQSPIADSADSQSFQTQTLSLVNPLDQSVLNESKTTLSGATSPSSWVVVLTENGEKIIQADKKGNFETEISLTGGENEIEVQSISEDGEKATKVITVVYTTAEI
jgi:hypothetical protein